MKWKYLVIFFSFTTQESESREEMSKVVEYKLSNTMFWEYACGAYEVSEILEIYFKSLIALLTLYRFKSCEFGPLTN